MALAEVDAGGLQAVVEREEDEDDEYEADSGVVVTLGLLEKPQNPHSLNRHFFPSKAGGTPVLFVHSFLFFLLSVCELDF